MRILYQTLFEPVRVAGAAETITLDKWHRPLAEPLRRVGLAAAVIASGAIISFTNPTTATADRFAQPLSQPTLRVGLPTHQQQATFFVKAAPFEESVSLDRWLRPLSEPVRVRPALLTGDQQAFAFVKAAPFPETTDPGKWYSPLSEPSVKARAGLRAGQQQSFIFSPAEEVTVAKWLQPFTEPVRFRQGLPTREQQTFAFVKAAPFAESVTVDRWLQPISEPRRFKPALATGEQQAFAFVKSEPFPETTDPGKWYRPFAEPLRSKRPVVFQQAFTMWPEPIVNPTAPVGVYAIYPDRALGRKFPAYEQQTFAFVKAAPFGESVTLDRWMQPIAVPVRTLRQRNLALYETATCYGDLTAGSPADAGGSSEWIIRARRRGRR